MYYVHTFSHPLVTSFRFVDSTRMIAVSQVGGIVDGDLKQMIRDNKLQVEQEGAANAANDKMYIKQAEHMLRSESYTAAAGYVMKALEMNPESLVF